MHDWTTYTTPDEFLADEAFCNWVRAGQFLRPGHPCTDSLRQHARLLDPAQRAADWLAATAVAEEPLSVREEAELVENAWRQIRRHEAPKVRPLWARYPAWLWRAAAVVLAVGLGWYAYQQTQLPDQATGLSATRPAEPTPGGAAWIRETNRQAARQLVSLPDGSAVWLMPGSTLRYPFRFAADRRAVELVGEAFFEITSNARWPFFVKTRTLTTRVVGTSFLVRAYERDAQATVQVRTGRVVVTANARPPQTGTVTLAANQQVTVASAAAPLAARPIRRPTELAVRLNEQPFEFNDAPLTTVLDALAWTYGVQIDYAAASFQRCRVTTTLSDEPLTEKLSILAEIIGPGTRYEVEGNRIRFTGNGCP